MSDQTPPPPSSSNTTNPNTTSTRNNTSTTNNTNNNDTNTTPSLPSRIQSSASNLARNAFFNSTPPGDIANALPGGSKAGPASSTGARTGTGHYHTEASIPGSSSSSSARGIVGESGTGDSFRSGGTVQNQDDEEAFQRGYHYQGVEGDYQQLQEDLVIENPYTAHDKGKGKGKATEPEAPSTFDDIWQTTTTTTSTQLPQPHPHPQLENQHHQDGAEVLTLLSSPSFNPDFPPSLDELNNPNYHPDATLIPTDLSDQPPQQHMQDKTLTQTEMQILDSFRRQDPHPHPHQQQHRQRNLNPTSLVPDIGAFLDTTPQQNNTADDATSLRDAVLTGLPGAEDWVAVEEMYQDEVWGYLKPALQAAAKEMEEQNQNQGQGGPTGEDGPAVARLKMILRHMGA